MMDIIQIDEFDKYVIMRINNDDFGLHEVTKNSAKTNEKFKSLNFPNVIVDLTKIQYIDTSGIGFIANTKNMLKSNGSELVITCDNENILDIMRIIKLNSFVKIFSTLEAAEEYMKNK